MAKPRVRMARRDALRILWSYTKEKTAGQLKVVIPLVLLLLFFQLFVLQIKPVAAGATALGIGLVIIGLTFFLEGIRMSVMPLGEEIGLQLPVLAGIIPSLLFGLILGVGATLAEPAIGVLRLLGSSLSAWDAPLLFLLLNRYSLYLVLAIGAGVGIAVVLSLLRSYFNWSLKPMLFISVPLVLGLTILAFFDPNLRLLTGLAWDTGGATTGPVTVPLVVALGMGVSRTLKREEAATSGLGVVTLASLLPIAAVLTLGIVLLPTVPDPMDKGAFFSGEKREQVLPLFDTKEIFQEYAAANGVIVEIGEDESDDSPECGSSPIPREETIVPGRVTIEITRAARAVLPLSIVLMVFLVLLLRRRVAHWDEVFLGIGLALMGMMMLNTGIEEGLARLGRGVGQHLPAAFQPVSIEQGQFMIPDFDPQMVENAVSKDGTTYGFFYLERNGEYLRVPYSPERYDPDSRSYLHVPIIGPLFGNTVSGIILVLLFAWFAGYTATTAEPALSILGGVVEEVTAGTLRGKWLARIVGVGVGAGMIMGVVKILFHIPMLWMLAPPYVVLLLLTLVSTEEFVNIAWDSAGVTTGPVTVPLIIAIGLGLSGEVGTVEGFGIISLASAYPIITVLVAGIIIGRKERAAMRYPA